MGIYLRGKSYYYDFMYKGQRYTGCIGPVSRTVAKEEEARKKAAVVEGRLNPQKNKKAPRFDAFATEYLEWSATTKKPLTVLRNRKAIHALSTSFGHKKLDELTAWHVEQYKKSRREAEVTAGSINYELATLRSIL